MSEIPKDYILQVGDIIKLYDTVCYTKDKAVCIIEIDPGGCYKVIDKKFRQYWINKPSIKKLIE